MWIALVLALFFQDREIVTDIQVHGNLVSTDEEVQRLAGVQTGMPFETNTIDEVAARLRATKKFEKVQVLKRFASIADPSHIVLVIIVDEGPVRIVRTDDPAHLARAVRHRRPNLMFLPVLDAEDGYGATYGVQFALPDPAGTRSRVSFPLTWGGEKRAAVEFDKRFDGGPLGRVLAGGSISRRTHPFFGADDDRGRVWLRGEREIVPRLRVAATAAWQRDSFLGVDDHFTQAGADVVLDTRLDPMLARNAVYARAAWDHFSFAEGAPEGGRREPAARRLELEARGYVGLVGQNILAVRALRTDSDRPLPPYLQPLLGGMANLRGFAAGTEVGDTLVASSAELIVPLTSPLNLGKIGVSAFIDAATIYNNDDRRANESWKQGYGGSLWLSAAVLRLNIAVAHGRGSSTRIHVGANVSF